MTTFTGYSPAALQLLSDIGDGDREWFTDHRSQYEAQIVKPTKALVVAVGEELQARVSPNIQAQPKTNGSIAPINNDLRFAKDKAAYKDHLLLRFWEGPTKKTAPTLFLRVSADSVGLACGMAFDPAGLERWRAAVAGPQGEALASDLHRLMDEMDAEVVGQELKRVPAPYPSDSPRADLLRHKWLQVRWLEPTPVEISDERFVDWCASHLQAAVSVQRWLVAEV